MQKKLEIITNVAIVCAALLICFTLYRQHLHRAEAASTNAAESDLASRLNPGKQLSAPAGYVWAEHDRTLMLALRYGCIHCEHNMDFYGRLVQQIRNAPTVALVSVFPDDRFVAEHDLDTHGLQNVQFLANTDFDQLHVFGTPTLLLVNNQGTIVRSWIGELSSEQQADVMAAIK